MQKADTIYSVELFGTIFMQKTRRKILLQYNYECGKLFIELFQLAV